MAGKPIGNTWLQEKLKIKEFHLTHQSNLGSRSKIEIQPDGTVYETYQANYALSKDTPLSHLEFALKYDNLQLDFYKSVFHKIPFKEVAIYVDSAPTSKYARKIGYWYEFLTGKKLPVNNREKGNYADLLECEKYYTGKIIKNARWLINDNLPGGAEFCPVVRKTNMLTDALSTDVAKQILELRKQYPPEIFNRTNNYLYKKETRSSFQIEKEEPTPERIERFISLLNKAGEEDIKEVLSERSLIALQKLIVDKRFAAKGFRDFQNYIGQTSWNYEELIHYICPPPDYLSSLMQGLSYAAKKSEGVHPIVRATIIAFGFVFIHPFEDGNGRIHRFLVHDILTRDKIVPKGMILPISAHMFNNMKQYDEALEVYSKPLLSKIKYSKTGEQELMVLNPSDVEAYYRFPDLTAQTQYLAEVVNSTIVTDMPREFFFLQSYDEVKKHIQQKVDMPDKLIDLFIKFTHHNEGVFPKGRRKHFSMLTDKELSDLQNIYRKVFGKNKSDNS